MNSARDVEYRLGLAKGFLKEAEEDYQLTRWRACVDNSQLSVENAGKAVLMLFGISPKTRELRTKHEGDDRSQTHPA